MSPTVKQLQTEIHRLRAELDILREPTDEQIRQEIAMEVFEEFRDATFRFGQATHYPRPVAPAIFDPEPNHLFYDEVRRDGVRYGVETSCLNLVLDDEQLPYPLFVTRVLKLDAEGEEQPENCYWASSRAGAEHRHEIIRRDILQGGSRLGCVAVHRGRGGAQTGKPRGQPIDEPAANKTQEGTPAGIGAAG